MTITESLAILRAAQDLPNPFQIQLACSFTPLHLKTLLAAHQQQRMPQRRAIVVEGVFGDLIGSIASASNPAAIAVVIEWQDLDPRLRYREGAAWGRTLAADLIDTARMMLGRIEQAIGQLPPHVAVAVSLPTLPLVPIFHPSTWQAGQLELLLERELSDFASRVAGRKLLNVVNRRWLDEHSPASNRFDLKSDLLIGFPYTIAHADQLADVLALNLAPRQPLKGVITDLDNTFWNGLVGEIGTDAVRWDPASRYYLHGLYQKLLAALADEGILVGIASKNDPNVVGEALKRNDLLCAQEKIFPVEVHWSPKSESVGRILKAWNIGADAVAFIDDTPLELAEVAAAHPGITCLQFPVGDYQGVWNLLRNLRDLCGKPRLSEEDALRLESIRRGAEFQQQAESGAAQSDDFLKTIDAVLTFDFETAATSARTLELINKTNQFNLNGVRLTEADWQQKLVQPGAFVLGVKYEDKFGALGTIAAVQGRQNVNRLEISAWVMSCRAFSRRIEHQTLKRLFDRFGVDRIEFKFAPTAKNGPTQEFFGTMLGHLPDNDFGIDRAQFESVCPALYHRVEEISGVTLNG
ncbi:MAG TPA: HAD-IIIC family phosphatase [Bryobacteraceae bacterium]|nr:HAD-IIIC family phosphatase [Bryobacteraceae bacterium]